MSNVSTMIDMPGTANGVATDGRVGADWLHDPLEALTRLHGPYTLENADAYLDQEAVELYNGWLVWQEMTNLKERTVIGTIQDMLGISARKANYGQVLPDQTECLLNNGDVIKPDACLISWERLEQAGKPQGPNQRILLTECPELVIESRSPSNWRKQEALKREQYFANGTEIVWDVDEAHEVIYVYRATMPKHPVRYDKTDVIDCDLLPNWQRPVADIFTMHVSAEAVAGEVADAWREEGIEIGEARGIEIGEARGIEIGEARGIEIGEARGIRQGLLAAIDLGLELKFGETLSAIHQVQSLDALRNLYDAIKTAQSLTEVRELHQTLAATCNHPKPKPA